MRRRFESVKTFVMRYAGATLAVALVGLVKLFIKYEWGIVDTHFLFSSLAIVCVALMWGVGPGLFATAVSAVANRYLFQLPFDRLNIQSIAALVEGLLFTALGAYIRAEKLKAAIVLAETERLVKQQTKDLTERNTALEAEAKVRRQAQEELARSITSAESARAEAESARASAEAANLAKSAFLANMSHEIRTPLGAVLGFSELLANNRSNLLSSSDRVNFVAAVKRNGELLSNIISDILDLSKVEAGKLEVERHDVSIEELLSDTKALLSLQAMEKGLKLTVESDGAIPDRIRTDPLRLRQILLNIVGNAIKFTRKGTVLITVKQLGDENGQKLAFIVADTGPGISPQQAVKLFAPFAQADISTKREFGGTGLGLVLSRRLANLLGGDVVLTKSAVGVGSTFTVTIGLESSRELMFATDAEGRNHVPSIATNFAGARLQGVKILLAEDSLDNQVLITHLLRLEGATVTTAKNGKEALEKVHNGDYDFILMDLQMPVMDGFEATAALRKEGYKRPVIALTAHALNEERKRCLSSGFDSHFTKPIDRLSFVQGLAKYCGHA